MVVAELIAKLSELPADAPVLLSAWNGDHYNVMEDLDVRVERGFNLSSAGYDEAPTEAWRTFEMHLGPVDLWDAEEWDGESREEVEESFLPREVIILSSESVDAYARSHWEF